MVLLEVPYKEGRKQIWSCWKNMEQVNQQISFVITDNDSCFVFSIARPLFTSAENTYLRCWHVICWVLPIYECKRLQLKDSSNVSLFHACNRNKSMKVENVLCLLIFPTSFPAGLDNTYKLNRFGLRKKAICFKVDHLNYIEAL